MANTDLTLEQALHRAIECHKAGNLPEAERLYRAILQTQPSHAFANHNLASLAVGVGRIAEALPYFEAALRAAPQQEASWLSYVAALANCGRLADARRALLQARDSGIAVASLEALEGRLPREPTAAEIGTLQRAFEAGSFTDLERAALPLTEAYPQSALAWKALGLALVATARPQEALPVLDRSLALRADDPEVYAYQGDAFRRLGDTARAEASYRHVIALQPAAAAGAHLELGKLLFAQDRFAEAEGHFRRVTEAQPALAEAHSSLGTTLRHLGRLDEAEGCFREAVARDPGNTHHHYNLGNLLRDADRPVEAEAPYRRALELDADNRLAMNNLAETLVERGRFAEALDLLRAAIARHPDYATAHWNKSLLDLRLGNFAEGWRGYEWRWRYEGFPTPRRDLPRPLWLGEESVDGKTVAVPWEQGLGDTIHFCRYLPLLEARGARVLFAPQRPLRGLMKGLPGSVELIDLGDLIEGRVTYDFQVPLISLPLALGTASDSIPNGVPYLRADPARVERWRDRIGGHGFKVGICWQGNTGALDRGRSFPVTCFAGIARLPGVRLISLHKGEGLEQLSNLPNGLHVETPGDGFDAGPDAFVDTAAVMTHCDLVITSDTAVAHLAGALGIRTWVALKAVPDWRWQDDRTDSPWYPTLRLFRQSSRGDWQPVFREIEAELARLLEAAGRSRTPRARAGAPSVPVSWGELVDKITILEIKSERLRDERARANVGRELALLAAVVDPELAASPDLVARKAALRAVNEALWDIEDALRQKEATGQFDDRFVALARSVYRQNDQRAALKRQINELLGSELVEEKSYEPY
ncbi:MAG: DUF6165 family protein [Reyranella sp.]|uniref:DUF6165 family protein n=1 Tax=Reyranella sp. TaxID=1929291 RepID=UPI003D09CC65